jgi:hypothetical protein
MPERFFSEDEAQEILRLAVQSSSGSHFTQERLVQTAAELGVPEKDVLAAMQELERRKAEEAALRATQGLRREFRRYRGRNVLERIGQLFFLSALFAGIEYLTSGLHSITGSWCIWPIGFIALGVLGEVVQYVANPSGTDREFAKWRRKRRKWDRAGGEPLEEVVQEALDESGPGGKLEAIKIVSARTGLDRQDAEKAIELHWRV